jgi:acetyl esterase/lipase
MKSISNYVCLTFTLLITLSLQSQDKVIDLYPSGKIPYRLENNLGNGYEYENGLIRRKKTIQTPSIEIFYPKDVSSNMPAVLICPGGGYSFLSHLHEGVKVAELLRDAGIVGIIVNSRLPDDRLMTNKTEVPLLDAQAALRYVRENSKELKIQSDKIGVMGFSAGGHLASTVAVHYGEKLLRPDISILVYPVITMEQDFTHQGSKNNLLGQNPTIDQVNKYSNHKQVTPDTPPTFIVHSIDDKTVPVQNSLQYIDNLISKGVKNCAFHIFPNGGHGYGLAQDKTDQLKDWPNLMLKWLKELGW